MCEAEVYYIFYEGANPESKDLLNSSSGGNFTQKRVSEAREILGRLIDAKKTYDSPRTILKRGSVEAVNVKSEHWTNARIDKLEKAILIALGKNNSPDPGEKNKQTPGPEEVYQCYGQQEGTETEGTRTGEAETGDVRTEDDDQSRKVDKPVPQAADQNFPGPGVEAEVEEIRRENRESSKGNVRHNERQVKPFPHRGELRKKKEDPADFMEIFGKLEVNLPFLQALKLPIFSKFIKEFIAGKTKPSGKIVIRETVSAVIQKRRMPSKRTDPCMFTLPISIGNIKVEHAMCDLGASINVLPLSLYKKLEGVRMVDTKVVIQLADRSCISPEGVLENVKVKRSAFRKTILRTAKTIIDVFDGTICLDYHGEKFTFTIDEAMKKPLDIENMHAIDVINPLVQEFLETKLMQEQVENSELSHYTDKEVANWCEAVNTLGMTDEELVEAILKFCKDPKSAKSKGSACVAKVDNFPEPEGLITKEELKTLPPGLRYAYLEENAAFPVIINNNLTREQEEELLEVLRKNKTAIGCTLSDLVGINPDLCMHHIRLEEGAKPHRDSQRKLNPNMREEVLKEVLKLLSLGIIYSIPDSKWEGIFLGHVVSEKGIQVDKAKEIRGFLGHAGFYRRFIKDFAKIPQPLTRLLQNDVDFNFDEACQGAFQLLKERLVSAPIIRAPDWNYPFEVMCDASDFAVGAVLGQRIEGRNYVIFYASKTLNQA
ncbi:uncharacterized protein LOC121808932 [Salvia splendens]|uniref:uncharacterized protein LOC121808932 n=1 Tax=Salvia splendens TaxID=180675 RepID=UPI001C269305|nr:uncharacterized protein LOC121808932 [Salvia splendens]